MAERRRLYLMTLMHDHADADRRIITRDANGEGFLWVLHPDGMIEPEDPDDPRLGGRGTPYVRRDLKLS